MVSRWEVKCLEGECQQKNKELARMVGVVLTKKSLREDAASESLYALKGADELRQQYYQAFREVKWLKRETQQLQHELQVVEASLMAKWLTSFYTGFDSLVKVAKDKFPGVDLIDF